MLSRVTGFVRDMVLANFLGAGAVSDAFFVSFKLPNLFRSLFAEGAFSAAFVPIISQKLASEGKKSAIHFASQAISVLTFIILLFVLAMEFLMPYIVPILAPGFMENPEKIELATSLCRITFPFLLFIAIVSFQSGILNSLNKFAAPACAPIILNLTMVISAFAFLPLDVPTVYGIAAGVTVAGFLEIIWLSYFLHGQGVKIHPHIHVFKMFSKPDIKTLFKRIAPGVMGAGIYQINMAVDTILVSLVGTGAISWLYYANRLQQLPLGVVGAAIGVAVLPLLSKYIKTQNLDEAKNIQDKAVEYGLFLSVPAAALLIALAVPSVNVLFQHGKFVFEDTLMTAYAVIAYSFGLPAYVMVKALAPNFFARGDTKTPVKYSVVAFSFNLVACIVLMQFFGHVGIACATSASAFVSLGQYIFGLQKRGYWKFSPQLIKKACKIALASVCMGILVYISQYLFFEQIDFWRKSWVLRLSIMCGFSILGVASFIIFAKLFGVFNMSDFYALVKRRKNA